MNLVTPNTCPASVRLMIMPLMMDFSNIMMVLMRFAKKGIRLSLQTLTTVILFNAMIIVYPVQLENAANNVKRDFIENCHQ